MPAVTPPAVVAPAAQIPPGYAFRRARLGMDLTEWRASAPQRTQAPCVAAHPDVVVCRPPDQPLGGAYRVRDITHTFVRGRLAEVSFTTSIDGFAFVTAELKRDFGPPATIQRDSVELGAGFNFPHVLMTWRSGRSTIRLSDPAGRGDRLRVTISSGDPSVPVASGV